MYRQDICFFQVLIPVFQGYKVFPDYTVRLGRSRPAGVSSRLQHVEPIDSSQESQLSPSGL